MAGLQWMRLDTDIFDNPKFLYLKEDRQYKALVVYLEAMAYSARHALAGFVPKAALSKVGATKSDADRLVASSLWIPAPGGWHINDWDDYQVADQESKWRSERAKKAASARWASRNGKGPHPDDHA